MCVCFQLLAEAAVDGGVGTLTQLFQSQVVFNFAKWTRSL